MNPQKMINTIGNTPLVAIERLNLAKQSQVFAKMEGNNPAGSVKDRPAANMIIQAALRGDIAPGDTLIEATSGNSGIALAMVSAMLGYALIVVMPDNMSMERKAAMRAYGAQLIEVPAAQGMEGARDLAQSMQAAGKGYMLNQFANPDNPLAHYVGTGPEIYNSTQGKITHFVSAMGTTGTIMGVGRYLKEQNPAIQIIGVQPTPGSAIPGIRRWPEAYLPKIYDASLVDRIVEVDQATAEDTMRQMAKQEGIFAGVSSGGAMAVALQVAQASPDACVVTIVCDRGDRYLSTGVY